MSGASKETSVVNFERSPRPGCRTVEGVKRSVEASKSAAMAFRFLDTRETELERPLVRDLASTGKEEGVVEREPEAPEFETAVPTAF